MKISLIIVCVILCSLLTQVIYACEDMMPLGIQRTTEQADLIIIGQKVVQGPIGEKEFPFGGEPIWVDIKITKILKGNSSENPIRIQTNSPCGYGFPAPIDNKEYLMFFSWNSDSKSFNRVGESGETLLMLINETIYYSEQDSSGVYRQKEEKIDDFASRFGLTKSDVSVKLKQTFWQKIISWFKGLFS
jgi:hypothetical protein